MTFPEYPTSSLPEQGSNLSAYRRLWLLAQKPREAFSILSRAERRKDALLVFLLYFLVRFPVVLQRAAAKGTMEKLEGNELIVVLALGLILGMVATALLLLVAGVFLHAFVNVVFEASRPLEDAIIMPVLCLGPQLLLVFELPSLFLHFGEEKTFLTFLLLRLVADVLSIRAFYHGLRCLFDLSPGKAVFLILIPALLSVSLLLMSGYQP